MTLTDGLQHTCFIGSLCGTFENHWCRQLKKKNWMPAIFITKVMLPTSYILCGLSSKSIKGAVSSTMWGLQCVMGSVQLFIQIFLCFTVLTSFLVHLLPKKKQLLDLMFFIVKFQPYPTCGAGTSLYVNMFLNLIFV